MHPYLYIPREIAANLAMGIPAVRRARLKQRRAYPSDLAAQIDFFRRAVGPFAGKSIAEIGPGDDIPIARYVLEEGGTYVAIDRFLGAGAQERAGVRLYRMSIEDGPAVKVDAIVSYNVLEHLSDLGRAFANMARMLRPGGLMAHRIDYGPHDIWAQSADRRIFLKPPDWLWRLMGSNRGYPNRVGHDEVLALLAATGFTTQATMTGEFDAELVSITQQDSPSPG